MLFTRLNQKASDALLDFFVRLAKKAQEDGEGQDLVEYALIIGTVAAIGIAAVAKYGAKLKQLWDRVINSM